MKEKLFLVAALAMSWSGAMAQTYSAIELAGGSNANGIAGGVSVGQTGLYEAGRATLWSLDGNATDVHPSFLATPAGPGFSNIFGISGSLSVGLGQRNDSPNQAAAIEWTGGAPTLLANPFAIYSSVALATDGAGIVGWASSLRTVRGQPTSGDMHAILWDAGTGRVVADLSGGKVTVAYGVARGQQVGWESKGSFTEARLWRGTAASVVNLHPRDYDASAAYATDGVHQVGTVAVSVKVFDETRRNTQVLMNSASVWSGTAASLTTLPIALPGFDFSTAVATGVSGDAVCGYAMGKNRFGVTQTTHAVVWSLSGRTWVDLHGFLPVGYLNSGANGIDASGNVTGYATDGTGASHAMVWRLGVA